MPVASYLVDLAPRRSAERLRAIWDRYQPTGTFNANIDYESTENSGVPRLRFDPVRIVASTEHGPLTISHDAGTVNLVGGDVTFDDFALRLTTNDQDDGRIVMQGRYQAHDDAEDLRVSGVWLGGRFDSAGIPELMHLLDLPTLPLFSRGQRAP